jgi:exopolysaccharide production protein ExoZ
MGDAQEQDSGMPASPPAAASSRSALGRERLSVVTGRIITVQYLRAVAASLVVLHHALATPALAPYYVRQFGTYGVDLFFVISGYIMWSTTANGQRGPLKFWAARIVRIVPLYWFFTTLFVAIALLLPAAVFHAALEPLHVLKSYLFIPAEHPRLGYIWPVYVLGWTLNYEMFFYFVFGLCLFVPHRAMRLAALVAVLVLLVFIGLLVQPRDAIGITYTNPILLEFAAGAVLARVTRHLHDAASGIGWALISGAIIWLVIAYSLEKLPDPIYAHAVPAAAMLAGALVLEPLARRRPIFLGVFFGDASYSLYLSHPFVQRVWYFVLEKALGSTSVAVAAIFSVSAVIVGLAGGAACYLLVEKPVLRMGKRIGHLSS